MGILIGLPNAALNETQCLFIEKGSELDVILRNSFAATSAGDGGSINVWTDLDDKIRCESHAFQITQDSQIFDELSDAIEWADAWIEKINE